MQIIRLPRKFGKTTKCLEILRKNERSVIIHLNGLSREDHPYLMENPELMKRIFSIEDYKERLRGLNIDIFIIDDADILSRESFFELLFYIQKYPLVTIFLTITDKQGNVDVGDLIGDYKNNLKNIESDLSKNMESIKSFMVSQNIQNQCFLDREMNHSRRIGKIERALRDLDGIEFGLD